MNRRLMLKGMAGVLPAVYLSRLAGNAFPNAPLIAGEPMATGKFKPEWASLAQYAVPEWYRDAKFGIWAHWGAQCQPEYGDWYAREMYNEGSGKYTFHRQKYGPQSTFGFKDVIHEWKAENWNPDQLVALYRKAGAEYFVAMANHHDNFDNYDSTYQSWNSTRLGPKKDIIGGWAKAAKKHGLRFGVSVHAAHAWTWYETAQRADIQGAYAGVPYDGKLTKADGAGTWWAGYDPQELYAQNHTLSEGSDNTSTLHKQWTWENGASKPSRDYCEKFYNRTVDLINKYQPDLVYFDDTALPLWPVSDAGLRIAAHLYNSSMKRHGGKLEAVLTGKILTPEQQKCMVWDIERGQSNKIEPFVWQTDTCLGDWHYNRRVYDDNKYKTAQTVVHTLADVISKNGNLLLNVPVRGDGSIDEKEQAVVEGVAAWMAINRESIFGTRPWRVFGEGPAIESAAPLTAQGFNEGKNKPFGVEDIRFTQKGNALYAIVMGWPADGVVRIKSLRAGTDLSGQSISRVDLLGVREPLTFSREANALEIRVPGQKPGDYAYCFKLT